MRLREVKALLGFSWQREFILVTQSPFKTLLFVANGLLKEAVGYLSLEKALLTQGREPPLPAVQVCIVL